MKVKFDILFPVSMYLNLEDDEPTRMRVKNIKAFRRISGLDLRGAKEFVESCERDFDEEESWDRGEPFAVYRTIILTAEQWGMLHLLRESGECSFFAQNIEVLDYDYGHISDFSGGAS